MERVRQRATSTIDVAASWTLRIFIYALKASCSWELKASCSWELKASSRWELKASCGGELKASYCWFQTVSQQVRLVGYLI